MIPFPNTRWGSTNLSLNSSLVHLNVNGKLLYQSLSIFIISQFLPCLSQCQYQGMTIVSVEGSSPTIENENVDTSLDFFTNWWYRDRNGIKFDRKQLYTGGEKSCCDGHRTLVTEIAWRGSTHTKFRNFFLTQNFGFSRSKVVYFYKI